MTASEAEFDRAAEIVSVDTVAVTFNEALRAVVDAVHDGVIDPERVAVGGKASLSTLGWPHRQRLASLVDGDRGEVDLVARAADGFRTLVTGRVDGRPRTARRHVPQMERHVWVVCDGDGVSANGEISVDAVSEAAVRRAVDDALLWVLRLAREVIDGRRDAGEADLDRGGGSATPAD